VSPAWAANALEAIRPKGLLKVAAIPTEGGAPVVRVFDMPAEKPHLQRWIGGLDAIMNLYFEPNVPRSAAAGKSKRRILAALFTYTQIWIGRPVKPRTVHARGT
jgi:hypothetical protein